MRKQDDLNLHRLEQALRRAEKRLAWMKRSVLDLPRSRLVNTFAGRRVKTLPHTSPSGAEDVRLTAFQFILLR